MKHSFVAAFILSLFIISCKEKTMNMANDNKVETIFPKAIRPGKTLPVKPGLPPGCK